MGTSERDVVLYRVRPGEVCLQTLSCLIGDQSYVAEVVAEADLSGERGAASGFRAKFAKDEAFRDVIMASIPQRFAEYRQLVEDVRQTGFDARLAKMSLRFVTPEGRVGATDSDLATETASGQAYVSRRLVGICPLHSDPGVRTCPLRTE